MKDKCLVPLRVLNQTYSIEEIDIDIQRPNIDNETTGTKINQQSSSSSSKSSKQFVIEKSRVTITKHTISKSEIKTITQSVPKIVITDWDKKAVDPKDAPRTSSELISKPSEELIEFNKQVSSKIVEEKTVDQFKDMDIFEQQQQPKKTYPKTPSVKKDPKDFAIDVVSLSSEIKCKCCISRSPSSYCSRGSYIIVKNSQPANIQFEQFDSRLEDSIETRNEDDNNDAATITTQDEHLDKSEYYLINPKLKVDETNNNEANFPNKNLDGVSQLLNNFENDEYHLANLKNFAVPQIVIEEVKGSVDMSGKVLIEEISDDLEKARKDVDHKACSMIISNDYIPNSSNHTPKTSLKENHDEFTPVTEIPNPGHMNSQEIITPLKGTRDESDYLYLYISGAKCTDIFTHGKICLEKTIHDGKIVEGILLLSLPPSSSDAELLAELYGPGAPFDKFRVQCCIKLNRLLFEKSKHLKRISVHKYLCLKRIEFGSKFPKHEFRYRFNKP